MSSKQLFPQNLITSSLLLYSSLTLIDGFMSLIHSASSVSSRCRCVGVTGSDSNQEHRGEGRHCRHRRHVV